MKNSLSCLVLISLLFCNASLSQTFKSVTIDTVLKAKISIRAIVITKDRLYFAGDESRVGFIRFDTNQQSIVSDTLKYESRSIAVNGGDVFALSIGNPARLRKFSGDLKNQRLVYKEENEKVFYDSMQFWNTKEGIAVGDPTEDCLSVLITRDGGTTWNKQACYKLPKIVDGEAAFAASNTNIVVKGNKTWVVTGGKKARVFYSPDKGRSWEVYETPIVQGESMTGIFTADFYNDKIGVIAGGNYEKPNQDFQNKAVTQDGGKTWKLIAENSGFGYASCIQFVPKSKGRQLVSVGTSGLYYSADGGNNWLQLSKDPALYTIRFVSKNTAYAAGKNKIIRITFKK